MQFLGVCEGQMQMGHMRFEPNINVHITDDDGNVHKTAITEIKNLNSFSVLERATAYEIQRQIQRVGGDRLARQEEHVRLGRSDASRRSTSATRKRRHDYRYFPDPDLVPVEVSDAWLAELKSQVGELPAARRKRYVEALGLSASRRRHARGRPRDRRLLRAGHRRRRRAEARLEPDALARPALCNERSAR